MDKQKYRIVQYSPNTFHVEKTMWTTIGRYTNEKAAKKVLKSYQDANVPKIIKGE